MDDCIICKKNKDLRLHVKIMGDYKSPTTVCKECFLKISGFKKENKIFDNEYRTLCYYCKKEITEKSYIGFNTVMFIDERVDEMGWGHLYICNKCIPCTCGLKFFEYLQSFDDNKKSS